MLLRLLQLYIDSFRGLSKEIWLLALITLINRSGTMVILFLSIYLTNTLGFTLGQAGMVMSCFGLGSVAGSYLGGKLTDRFGYYSVMFWSLFIGGAFFFLLMQMTSLFWFCMVTFLLTTTGDMFRPANFAAIHAYSKPENQTRSLSLIRLAINLGFSVGPAAGGIIAVTMGYQWIFVIDGGTCMLAALLFAWIMSEKKGRKKREQVEAPVLQQEAVVPAHRDKAFMLFMFFMLLQTIAFMQLFTTLPKFYKDHFLLNEDQIGLLMGLNGLLIAILEMPIIFTIEKRFNQLSMIAMGALLIMLSYLLFNIFPFWTGVVILSMLAITLGEIINFPFTNAWAMNRTTAYNRGQYMGIYTMTFSVAHVVAPSLGMQIAQNFGYQALWYVVALLGLAAYMGYLYIQRQERRQLASGYR
jgi:predicted MFS family arabinose efflux permease